MVAMTRLIRNVRIVTKGMDTNGEKLLKIGRIQGDSMTRRWTK